VRFGEHEDRSTGSLPNVPSDDDDDDFSINDSLTSTWPRRRRALDNLSRPEPAGSPRWLHRVNGLLKQNILAYFRLFIAFVFD